MPFTDWSTGDLITATKLDNDNTVSVGTDTVRTITVTHTWTASQTFTGGWAAAAACTITATSASSLAVGRQGATNPVLQVDASASNVVTGIRITGAAAAGRVAVDVISSGTNEGLDLDAKGSGTIRVGNTSTGDITLNRATTVNGNITGKNSAAAMSLIMESPSNDALAPVVILRSARGSFGSELYPDAADQLGHIGFQGYDENGTTYQTQATILANAWSDWSATNRAAYLTIATTEDASTTKTDRWYFYHNGHIIPAAGATYDIGLTGTRVRNIYTGGLIAGTTSYIGDTANANVTLGLTINQAGNDDQAFAVKSSDVTHAMTDVAEADTYYSIQKSSATAGGARVRGLSSGTGAFDIIASHTTDDTTKSTAGRAAMRIIAALRSGSTVTDCGANANLLTVENNGTTRFIVDAEGTPHSDETAATF